MNNKKTGKYNILYFSSFGSMKGGGQRSLFYLVRGLDKTRFYPIVVCPEEGELVSLLRKYDIETIVMPFKRLRQMSLRYVFRLKSLIKERKIAIVHTDAPTETLYAGIAAYLCGIPLVWHIRVSNNMFMDKLLSMLATKLILVADSLKNRFPYLKSDKVITILNGISVEEFDAVSPVNIKGEIGIEDNIVLIGCIGRIEEMKGQEYLVRAVDMVSKVRKDFHVIFIGEKNDRYYNHIVDLISHLKLQNFFSFLGYRTDTQGIIKNIDILISASSFGEGLSRVILEAMVASKPVIATNVGGASEAVIDNVTGYLIPSRNHKLLADAILKLLDVPIKRKNMGLQGRQYVECSFSLTDNIKKTEQLYLEILKNAD